MADPAAFYSIVVITDITTVGPGLDVVSRMQLHSCTEETISPNEVVIKLMLFSYFPRAVADATCSSLNA